nr:hypothetical protein CFP56_60319 [Quercus suber]
MTDPRLSASPKKTGYNASSSDSDELKDELCANAAYMSSEFTSYFFSVVVLLIKSSYVGIWPVNPKQSNQEMLRVQDEHCSSPEAQTLTEDEISMMVLKSRSDYVKGLGMRPFSSLKTPASSSST